MNAFQSVKIACENSNLQSALESHQILLASSSRANAMTKKENCSTNDFAFAQKLGVQLHESACMIQMVFDVEVQKFPN